MFDMKVQHRDTKTGRVIKHDPYRLHIVSGKTYYERPVGSGNLWWADGSEAGQIEYENEGKKKIIKEGAPHLAYQRPLSQNEKVQRELDSRARHIEDLEARLAELEAVAIREEAKESEAKVAKVDKEAEKKAAKVAAPKEESKGK